MIEDHQKIVIPYLADKVTEKKPRRVIMFKMLNPRRFYHAVGRRKFLEFILLAVLHFIFLRSSAQYADAGIRK